MSPLKSLAAIALFAIGALGTAHAQTMTDQFDVLIAIEETCDVLTATDIDFGSTVPAAGDVDQTGTINVACTTGTAYTLELDGGGSGDTAARVMTGGSGTDTIAYQLYSDAVRTTVWGTLADGEEVSGTGTGLGTANQIDHTVYARATLAGVEPPGNYLDTVTATLTF